MSHNLKAIGKITYNITASIINQQYNLNCQIQCCFYTKTQRYLLTEINKRLLFLRAIINHSKFMRRRSQKKTQDEQYQVSEEQQSKPKRVTRSKDKQPEIKQDKKEATKSERSKSRSAAKTDKPKSVNKKKKKKALKKQLVKQGYTEAQKADFKILYDKYFAMGTEALKNILASNTQTKTGTKDLLAERCADGKLLGKIPTCTSCGGGRLKFDRKTGVYSCPGYMDDDEFRNCGKKYEMAEIVRQPWTEP